jgi:hypothetical protein
MNLRHIWGDANCGSDLVSDTPTHNTANYGVLHIHITVLVQVIIEMTMNYMDYTDDRGMFIFKWSKKAEWEQYSFQEVQELASVYKTFQNY